MIACVWEYVCVVSQFFHRYEWWLSCVWLLLNLAKIIIQRILILMCLSFSLSFASRFGIRIVEQSGANKRKSVQHRIHIILICQQEALPFQQQPLLPVRYHQILSLIWALIWGSNLMPPVWPPSVILSLLRIQWFLQPTSINSIVHHLHLHSFIQVLAVSTHRQVHHFRPFWQTYQLLNVHQHFPLCPPNHPLNISTQQAFLWAPPWQSRHQFHQLTRISRQHRLHWHRSMSHHRLHIKVHFRLLHRLQTVQLHRLKIAEAHRSLHYVSRHANTRCDSKWCVRMVMTITERMFKITLIYFQIYSLSLLQWNVFLNKLSNK